MAVEGGTVSHYYILIISKFLILCRFSAIVCGFLFSSSSSSLLSLKNVNATSKLVFDYL